jgi:hypothetical protein
MTAVDSWPPCQLEWLHLAEFPEFPKFMSVYFLQDYFIDDEVFLNLSVRLT